MALPPMLFPNGMPAVRDANTWKVFMGITEENQSTYAGLADYASAPADEAWVYSCVKRLYTAAQSVPLRVYTYQSDGLDLQPVTGNPEPYAEPGRRLQHLLDWVNPVDMNGSDLKAYTMASKALWGGCYWKKVRGPLGGPPQELYWLAAPDMRPNAPDGRHIETYTYTPRNGQPQEFSPRDVVAFRDVNLGNPIEMLSPLSAARNDISVQRQAAIHTASTLANWGIPAGAWVVPKGEEITQQDKRGVIAALRALRGPKNAGKSAVLPAGLEWQPLAMHSQDAEWIEARRISRMTVCAVLGVPLVLAGDDEKLTTYASLRDARRIFWEDTVVPALDWVADMINGWLVPDFDPSGRTRVAFDYSGVVALKEPPSVEWNMALSAIQNQAMTPNEFRSRFRIGKKLKDGNRVTPKTTVTLRPDPAADPKLLSQLFPAMNPKSGVGKPPQTAELFQPGGAEGNYDELPALLRTPETVPQDPNGPAETLRSVGRGLYRQPAVKAFVRFGGPLDADALLGRPVDDAVRHAIEDGLRRRNSADQIARSLETHE